MSDHSSPQNQNDEVDLSVVFDKIKSIFKSFLIGLVMIFQFFWKHKFRLLIVLIIGFALLFLLKDKTEKIYRNEYLVKTNFGSTEYLYGKINSINAKLESKDTVYLEKVFGNEYYRVEELFVKPVIDLYSLVNKSKENQELFKLLLGEFEDYASFVNSEVNLSEYTTHKIGIYIKGSENNEFISNRLYSFLSENSYYNELKFTALESYWDQLRQNKVVRAQIDSIIRNQKENGMMPKMNENAISFEGSQNLKELLNQKRDLLDEDLNLRNQLSSEGEVLKIIDSSFGILGKEENFNYFKIPVILVVIYLLFFFIKYISRKILLIVGKD